MAQSVGSPRGGADQQARHGARSASASPRGRCAAGRSPHSAARRSSDSARCAPRLFGAMAWISSTITVRVRRPAWPAGRRAEQDVERLRRRHEDVRRAAAHARRARRPACRRCAPRCGSRRPAGPARAVPARMPASGASRLLAGCRWTAPSAARRRPPAVSSASSVQPLPHQPVDRGEEGRQRLARAGRRGDQRVPARPDRRPGFRLRRRRRGKARREPGGDGGMELRE